MQVFSFLQVSADSFLKMLRVLLFPVVLKQLPGHWLPFFVFSDTKEHVNLLCMLYTDIYEGKAFIESF